MSLLIVVANNNFTEDTRTMWKCSWIASMQMYAHKGIVGFTPILFRKTGSLPPAELECYCLWQFTLLKVSHFLVFYGHNDIVVFNCRGYSRGLTVDVIM